MKKSILASIILGALALSATDAVAVNTPTSGDFGNSTVQDWANSLERLNADVQNQITTNKIAAENGDTALQNSLNNQGMEINGLENHLLSVDNQTQTLKINNIQDRQELADHEASITKNANDIQYNLDQVTVAGQDIDANKRAIAASQTRIADNSTHITQNTQDIATTAGGVVSNKANIANNTTSIAQSKSYITGNTAAISANKADIAQNQSNISGLASGFQQVQRTGLYAQSRADAAYANTEANRQALQATNHRVADNSAAIADHEQRIEKLEASNSANFGKLKNEVDDNRQRASAAISGVAAMANIPQVIQGQTFSVGAGVGTTDSESALAVGFSARAAEHVVVKASVSDDTQQNFVVGGGVSYGW